MILVLCLGSGTVQHELLDVETFQAFKMRLSSHLHTEERDTQTILDWLDRLLGQGLRLLREAQDAEANAVSEATEFQTQLMRSSLAAQSEVQLHQDTIHQLHASTKEQAMELEEARQRLQQAAASAQNLAGTLATQECEILKLREALQKVAANKSNVSVPVSAQFHLMDRSEAVQSQESEKQVCPLLLMVLPYL